MIKCVSRMNGEFRATRNFHSLKNNENTRGEARKYISHGSEDGWQGSMVDSPRPRNRFPFSLSPRSISHDRHMRVLRSNFSGLLESTSPPPARLLFKVKAIDTFVLPFRNNIHENLSILFPSPYISLFLRVKNNPTFLKIEINP